jgi:hypothetical protein
MKPNVGQIFITAGHYCYNSKPDGNNTVLAGSDLNLSYIAILIGTEKGEYYCRDNYS